ncbi:uncharacterized protein LOC112903096 [Panicum hallii]|uniref:uncharacterized protein LOC112903096 n=1 Tax=Panicum hallii TaxID=206008 RepID=UPI000DF4D885|nr:uncharacterized protein LOC112903096 [Panicum hallii]
MKTEEWIELVKYWCDPKNQEKSAKNKVNRSKVQLHQKTGSRSYIAYRYSLRPKYNNSDPDAVEFFGECMKSSKNGRTPLANEIYERMVAEKDREPEEGEEKNLPPRLLMKLLARSAAHPHFFLTLVPLDHQRMLSPHQQQHKHASELSLRQPSKLKERKLLGSGKSCRHNFKLSRTHLKKTKTCCGRPKRK